MTRTSKRVKPLYACLSAVAVILCLCLVLLLSSCSVNKWIAGAGLPDPDTAFQTGTVAGYNVYIWECHQGKRIVLYHVTAELSSKPFERQETRCGETTEIEKMLASEQKGELDPKQFWEWIW